MPEKGEKLGIAQVPIRATLDELDKDLAAAQGKITAPLQKAVDSAQGQIDKAISGMTKGLLIGGIGSLVGGIAAAGKLAVDALPLEALSNAFAGVTSNADAMLAKLHDASMGMVRDADLMRTYNQAAQLVSKTFADQLPEAMGYLSKVAAATGQDMGYMLDSLVRGVGRLSPMILDNLAIQVQLSDATERASQMFGVQADQLSKTQTQAGMMAVVMEKLRANTASMPDLAGSAQQQWASLGVTLQNIKDQVGSALIPILSKVLGLFSNFVIEVTGGPEFEETINKIVEGLTWLVDKGAQAIDWFRSISPQAIAVAGAFSGVALILPTLVSGIAGVTTAIGAAGGAFTAFSALIAANPVGMAAIAIAAAGLGIAAIVNQVKKNNEELADSTQTTANSIAASATSYEEYLSAMGAGTSDLDYAARASEALTGELDEQRAALVLTEQEWLNFKAATEAAGGTTASADILRQLREVSNGMQENVGLTGKAAEDMAAQMSRSQTLMQQYAEQAKATGEKIGQAWADAFKADEVQKALMGIQTAVLDHQAEMDSLTQDFQAQQLEAQFAFDVQRLQAEQQYQREHAALLDAGRVEDAVKLEQKFIEQDGISRANFSVQQQLQQRALIVQQIQRQQAYIEELKEQGDQVRRTLAIAVTKSEAFLSLTATEQQAILDTIYLGGSEKLLMEREFADKSVEITTLMAQGNINAAKAQVSAFLEMQKGNLTAADKALNELNAKLRDFKITLPPLPAMDVAPLAASIPAISDTTRRAAERSTEPATRTLEQVASDIEKAIASAKEAIKSLVDVEVPTGVESGLGKIAAFLTMAVTQFYQMLSPLKAEVTGVKDLIAPVNELMQLITSSGQAMSGFKELPELPDTQAWSDRVLLLTQLVVSTLTKIKADIGSDALSKAKDIGDDVRALLQLIGVALKIEPEGATRFSERAQLYVEQLATVAELLYHWMADYISRDLEAALAEGAKVAGSVKEFFSLIGPDLSKLVPVTDFETKAEGYLDQLRWLTVLLYNWMQEIVDKNAETVQEAAKLPASVKEFFTLIGPDLSKLVPVTDFETKAQGYLDQLRWLTVLLYDWMQEIVGKDAETVQEAAKLPASVKEFFTLIGPDLSKLVPVTDFETKAEGYLDQLRWLMVLLYDWMQEIVDKNAKAVKEAAALPASVKEFFSLIGPDLSKLVPDPSPYFSRRVEDYLAQLKLVSDMIYKWMREIVSAGLGDAVGEAGVVSTKVKDLFAVLDISSNVPVLGASFGARLTTFIDGLKEAAPLLRKGLKEVSREWDSLEALDTSAQISKKLKEFFDILSLDKTFEELRVVKPLQAGERRTALSNIVNRFMIDLKTVAPLLAKGLAEVEELFDGALESSISIAQDIQAVFEAISGAVKAGIEITGAEGWDFAKLLSMIQQLEQAMGAIGQIRMPSIAVNPPTPAGETWDWEGIRDIAGGGDIADTVKEGVVQGLRDSELVVTLVVSSADVEERRQFSMKLGRLERMMQDMVIHLEAAGP